MSGNFKGSFYFFLLSQNLIRMGNNKSGVIWNDSDFDIKYYLSSQVAKPISKQHTH